MQRVETASNPIFSAYNSQKKEKQNRMEIWHQMKEIIGYYF